MNRREFAARASATGLMAALPLGALAQSPQITPAEGQNFVRLQRAVGVSAPSGKIEVVEFFWYGCPHCNAFEPRLEAWVKALPGDVAFRRVHVGFRPAFRPMQQLYATLEVMGQVDALHRKVFHAVHEAGERLDSADAIAAWAARNGLDRAKFTEVYNSFGVQTKAQQGTKLAESYKIDGVPALGIHGRYYTSPAMAGGDRVPEVEGQRRALVLADQLIALVRKGG